MKLGENKIKSNLKLIFCKINENVVSNKKE